MRLLFARAGTAFCPVCDEQITAQTPQQIVDRVLEMPEGTRFQVLAPVVRGRKGEYQELFAELQAKGYVRAVVDGEMIRLDSPPTLEKQVKHNIDVVVDRLVVKADMDHRLTDSVETALELADGVLTIDLVDLEEDDPGRRRRYSEKRACPNDHPLALEEIEPRTFSFNAPYGSCQECSGLGSKQEVDPELAIPDEELSLADGAVVVWRANNKYYQRLLQGLSKQMGFNLDTPWKDLPDDVRHAVMYGLDHKVHVRYRNRWGRERSYSTGFEGAVSFIERKIQESESALVKDRLQGYLREIPCPACNGARLRPEVLAVRVDGKNIAEVSEASIGDTRDFIANLQLSGREAQIAKPVVQEISARLDFLVDVGLEYLTLARAAGTLSGGEAQRIRLATQIGSGLVGVLYVLD